MAERTITIRARKGWRGLDLATLIDYRDLGIFLIRRGIKVRYAQSVIGVGWAIIQPLLSVGVFTVVFGIMAGLDSGGIPYALFSFTGILPWTFFANGVTDASSSVVMHSDMITKVYFPRAILPLTSVLSKGLDFLVGCVILVVFMAFFAVVPTLQLLWIPVWISVLLIATMGIGMVVAAMSVLFRDVKHAMPFLIQLLLYAAPVVYSTRVVPEAWLWIYVMNPMVGVVEGLRASVLGTPIPWEWIWPGALVAVAFFVFGAFFFRRFEHLFADVA